MSSIRLLHRLGSLVLLTALTLAASCGGGGGGSSSSSSSSGSGSSSSSGGTGSSSGSGSSSSSVDGHTAIQQAALSNKAGVLATALGRSKRLLIGLGTVDVAPVQAQKIQPDIYDQYLTGLGTSAWPSWNSPAGAYVKVVAANADTLGAVPMFTLYQMAANGDGVLTGLSDTDFMANYWSNVRLLFQQLAAYGKPALVNFEPDFWGYTHRANPDPTQMFAYVSIDSDCAALPNTVAGIAACLMQTARLYAPNAYVGFPPSLFADLIPTEVAYMQKLGAGQADFVVMQTLDRDAGCLEAQYAADSCARSGSGWYWDESNQTTPNFNQHFALASTYNQGLQLPLLWWQTPMGVPASSPSTAKPWRDNRVHYFLTHASQLVANGGVGAVFSPGQSDQTNILSDGGQFQSYSQAYLANPAALP